MRTLFHFGEEVAFNTVGATAVRRTRADSETPVEFEIEVDDIAWKVRFPISTRGIKGTYGEELTRAGEVVLRATMFEDHWTHAGEQNPLDETRCCAKVLWDRGGDDWMQPLVNVLSGIRVYDSYWLNQVKEVRPSETNDSYLHGTGRNIWSVLANWKASPLRYHGQFDWVMKEARRAFPGLLGTIEFDRGLPYLFRPDATDPTEGLPPNRIADGLLTGLLHLTAIAGAKPGSLVAIDEMENHLHPHAIRSLMAAMRQQAEERDVTIVLTTHSPVVLNQFINEPEQVFELDQEHPDCEIPARMTDLHSEEWIAQAKLGSLYERLAFSSPDIEG